MIGAEKDVPRGHPSGNATAKKRSSLLALLRNEWVGIF